MKFHSLDELPENNTLVWVKLPGEKLIMRLYQNDSFGLGDRDFEVIGWSNCPQQPLGDQAFLDCKQRSIRRVLDHINLGSLTPSLSLVR
jgi:hypothetical protein